MHPIERLRHVARADGAPAEDVVHAAAASLAGFAADPISLVTASRRLIERHPANGALWSLCARVVTAPDPADEAWRCLDQFVADPTVGELGHSLPEGASVVVVGGPHRLVPAFASRGDVRVTAVDLEGDAYGFERALDRHEVAGCELVGLVPRAVLDAVPRARWAELDLDEDRTIEARLARRGG